MKLNNNNNNNTKIIGESFFTKIPKDPILLETDFVRMDKSIIWQCNQLFWKYYTLWEKTYNENFEASLPSGVSESHRPEFIAISVKKFLQLIEKLQKTHDVPKTIFVYEQGPGTGIFAQGFLDAIKKLTPEIYAKLTYLLSDSSEEILKNCAVILANHKNHIKLYMQDAFEQEKKYKGKILFSRHSNIWDTWPCRLIQVRKLGLGEVYVRAVCDMKFEKFITNIFERGMEYAIVHNPTIWKDFFRNIKLQTRTIPCDGLDIIQNPYLQYLKNTPRHVGKNTLISDLIIHNLSFLNAVTYWEKGGYIEIVDIMTENPRKKMHPRKFDGAIGYIIDKGIIETWCKSEDKAYSFTRIRNLNTLLTISMQMQNIRTKLHNMVHNASFEFYPEENLLEKVQKLAKHSRIAVTCTSKKGLEYTTDTAIQLKKEGYNAYPHIVARLIQDETDMQHIKTKLTKNNMHDIFVAGGDIPSPAGIYPSAMSLLEGLKKANFPFGTVTITGYPEGHPSISKEKLHEALVEKQEFAQKEKIKMKIITQLCFDENTIISWTQDLKRQGITLPIVVGIPGPCNGFRLLQFALKCGVGASLHIISSKKELSKNITTHIGLQYQPDVLLQNIVQHPLFEKSNIVGFHFYTFNNLEGMVRLLDNFNH